MLIVFFIVTIIVIPGYFYYYFTAEKSETGGIQRGNRTLFHELIDEDLDQKKLPGILSEGLEFVDIKIEKEDEPVIARMKEL